METEIEKVISYIKNGHIIVMLTGAGVSTDSGVPDFRGKSGTRTNPDEAKKLMEPLMEKVKQIKYPHNFKRHPYAKELFGFDYLSFIEPNSAHYSIVELERKGKLTLLISQNVDNLHLKSEFPPNKLIEIHGNCFKLMCKKCNIHYDVLSLREKVLNDLSYIPSCDKCGGALSSTVVNFGDPIPKKELEVAIKISKSADVFLSVGSSLVVEPASLLLEIAKKNNAKIIIINIGKTQKDKYADVILNGKAGDILTKIVQGLVSYTELR